MQFGYFTLSDNAYPNNTRTPNELINQIADQAIYAEELGMHSAWIGEHHFSTLGVNSSPEVMLTFVAARTKNIRLAPAVTVLPLHHPIRVAEQWATLDVLSGGRVDFATGRGYDRREYGPFGANFEENDKVFAEGVEIVTRLWAASGPISHHGKYYKFEDVWITPVPVQRPIPTLIASFSKPSIELAARLGLGLVVAAGAATSVHGGLAKTAELYRETCAAAGTPPRRLITSYLFILPTMPGRSWRRASGSFATTRNVPRTPCRAIRTRNKANYSYFTRIVAKVPDDEAGGFQRRCGADRLVRADRRCADEKVGRRRASTRSFYISTSG